MITVALLDTNNIVVNNVVVDSIESANEIFTNYLVIQPTESTGDSFIGAYYYNNKFKTPIPPKPGQNYTWNNEIWAWEEIVTE